MTHGILSADEDMIRLVLVKVMCVMDLCCLRVPVFVCVSAFAWVCAHLEALVFRVQSECRLARGLGRPLLTVVNAVHSLCKRGKSLFFLSACTC